MEEGAAYGIFANALENRKKVTVSSDGSDVTFEVISASVDSEGAVCFNPYNYGRGKFTKSDLKDGMRVESRDGKIHYVCGQRWIEKEGRREFHDSDEFTNDLMHEDSKRSDDFDIIKVTDRDGTVLFERQPEAKEMTVADIEHELGYSVKVVK